jgi:hypothetical protein
MIRAIISTSLVRLVRLEVECLIRENLCIHKFITAKLPRITPLHAKASISLHVMITRKKN